MKAKKTPTITKTSCKSQNGITVGIIDAIITQCRVIKGRSFKSKAVREALFDLITDKDFKDLRSRARVEVGKIVTKSLKDVN